ncbi:MAG: MarR family transcriptional regulator [Chloroflexaceae bacterium]|nr:MarR family transcriptional regulator [Chloroflexaceae bacterium]
MTREGETHGTTVDEKIYADIEQTVVRLGWLSQRQLMQLLDHKRFRLTLPQFYSLQALHDMAGQCKMSTLAERTNQSAASLTGVVDRLIEKDWFREHVTNQTVGRSWWK